MRSIDFYLPMIPPTATYQEKQINWKRKTIYQNQESKDAREKLRAHLVKYIPDEPLTGPIRMMIGWYYPVSGSHKDGDWYTNKPDIDNVQKMLQDVMTELGFWKDDSQIASLMSSQNWSATPGIVITLCELPKNIFEEDTTVNHE